MADNPEPIEVSIVARIQGLLDGLGQATAGVKGATAEMQGSFSGLQKTIENLKAPFIAITALLAGGAMFKEAISSTVEWTMEVNKLSKVLNTTTQDASAWGVMLHTLGVSGEDLGGIVQRLQARVNTGAKAFDLWHVATKNAQGGALPMAQVIENMATKYQSLSTDQEKNTMLQELSGRAWMSMLPIMRMTADRMAEAREEAEKLHLVVGPEGVAKVREYQESMRKLDLIQKSLQIQVGNALLPTLTSLGIWLGETGPGMAAGMAAVLKSLVTGFITLKGMVEITAEVMMGWAMVGVKTLETVGNTMNALVTGGDFIGAAKRGSAEIKNEWDAMAESIKASAKQMADGIAGIWNPPAVKPPKAIPDAKPKPGKAKKDKGGDDGEAMSWLEEQAWEMEFLKKKREAEVKVELDTAKDIEEGRKIAEKASEKTREQGLKAWAQKQKEQLQQQKQMWDGFFGSMTSGFQSSIQGLMKGTMTWGEAFTNVISQALEGIISFFTQWGIEEAIHWATSKAMGTTTRVSEATGAAAVYGINAMASVAAIPMIGWSMAPGVGAAAYSEGMGMAGLASAAGGWDRVPSDQLAQIHKNEMVLSAPLAEGMRDMIGQGKGGGGETHLHVHAVDDRSVLALFRKHRGSLVSVMGEALRDGRKS